MYRSSPFRSNLNTGYITCLGMCKVCTEAVHSVALLKHGLHYMVWDMCKVCTESVHVWTCVKVCTEAVHSVALWTRVTLHVWACVKVCTEAVHSVALWTRVTLHVWTCVKYVPKSVHSVAIWNTGYITLGHSTCVVKTCKVHGAVNTSSA